MNKSNEKMGQDGAKAIARLKILSMTIELKRTGFLPNLKNIKNTTKTEYCH